MKLLLSGLLAAAILTTGALASPGDTAKKVGKGAENVGKTVVHGTTAVGKGASRIYHNGAHAVQKLVAKNTKNKNVKRARLNKAASHYKHADKKTDQSEKAMKKAEKSAGDVTE
jgi:hypothetical protein